MTRAAAAAPPGAASVPVRVAGDVADATAGGRHQRVGMHSDLHRLLQRTLHETRLRDATERRAVAAGRTAPSRRRVVVGRALQLLARRSPLARRRLARWVRG